MTETGYGLTGDLCNQTECMCVSLLSHGLSIDDWALVKASVKTLDTADCTVTARLQ